MIHVPVKDIVKARRHHSPLSALEDIKAKDTSVNLFANALTHFNGSSIVGSSPVTEWTNLGTGGSDYDLTSVVGTNTLSKGTRNGADVVVMPGSCHIETVAPKRITGVTTEFLVGKMDATGASSFFFYDGYLSSSNRHALLMQTAAAGDFFVMFGGVNLIVPTFDTDWHVYTLQYTQTAGAKLTVSGVGSTVGSAGTYDYDFSTFMAAINDASRGVGSFGHYSLFDSANTPTAEEITAIQNALKTEFNTA